MKLFSLFAFALMAAAPALNPSRSGCGRRSRRRLARSRLRAQSLCRGMKRPPASTGSACSNFTKASATGEPRGAQRRAGRAAACRRT